MRTEYPHSILVVPRRPHPPGPVRSEKTGVWMAAESLKQHFKRRAMVIAERLELELTASSPQTAPPFPSCCPDLFYLQNARDQHALSCVHAKNKTIRYRAIFMRCATRTGGGDRVSPLGTERFQVFCTPTPPPSFSQEGQSVASPAYCAGPTTLLIWLRGLGALRTTRKFRRRST